MNRREFLEAAGAGAAALGLSRSARRASRRRATKIRVGYLHTLAVDGQMWLAAAPRRVGEERPRARVQQFTTGLELFQAMIGGSIDMLRRPAPVISNFPARGQGKMFLVNCVEFAHRAALGARGPGRQGLRRPEGQEDRHDHRHHRARVPRHRAARQQARPGKDVEIVNQRMAEAVTSFISGAVPGGRALGAVQHHRARQGARREEAGRRLGLLSAGGDRPRLGRAPTTSTRRTARSARA